MGEGSIVGSDGSDDVAEKLEGSEVIMGVGHEVAVKGNP